MLWKYAKNALYAKLVRWLNFDIKSVLKMNFVKNLSHHLKSKQPYLRFGIVKKKWSFSASTDIFQYSIEPVVF